MTDMTVRRRTLVTAALALLIGLGVGAPVGAERVQVPPHGDSHQRACYKLQQDGDALVKEYAGATHERRLAIIQELRNQGTTWRQIGCQAVWGNIAVEIPTDINDPNVDPGMIDEMEIIDDGDGLGAPVVTQPVVNQPVVSQPTDDQDQDHNTSKKDKKGKKGGKRGGKGHRK